MKLIRRLLAVITGFAIALAIWGFITPGTLFSAKTYQATATASGIYPAIAAEMPALLSQVVPLSPDERVAVAPYLDTQLVAGWGNELLPKLETYYRQGGARPTLDLSTVTDRLSAAGIPIPETVTAELSSPVTITAGRLDRTISEVVRWSSLARLWGLLIALVGLVLGLILSRGHRFFWLGGTLIWAGIFVVLAWVGLAAVPKLVSSTVANSAAGSLAVPLRTWIESAVITPRHELIIAAAVVAVITVISYLTHFVAGLRPKRKHEA